MKHLAHLTIFLPLLAIILLLCQGCAERDKKFNANMLQNIPLREIGPGKMGKPVWLRPLKVVSLGYAA